MDSKAHIYNKRIERVRTQLQTCGVEGALFFDLSNIRYLTGFTGSEGVLFLGRDRLALLVDGRYTTQAGRESPHAGIVPVTDKMEGISNLLAAERAGPVGFESSILTYDGYTILHNRLPAVELLPLSSQLSELRAVKDEEEVRLIKAAAGIAARALRKTLEGLAPGIREREIAALLESAMLQEGSEKPSFETIVASGENAALPHAHPGDRTLRSGDFVVIDYGAVYGGYHSDETCTIALGALSSEQEKVYTIVKSAHDRALEAVRPGALAREIDGIARRYIDDAGYGSCFSHGTGHGVGLAVHEAPVLSPRSRSVLEEGMIITVEPGVYIPGSWGIRIEDMILVTADGFRMLTEMPKHLVIL